MKSGQRGQTQSLYTQISTLPTEYYSRFGHPESPKKSQEEEDLDDEKNYQAQRRRKQDLYRDAEATLLKKKYQEILNLEFKCGLNAKYNELDEYHLKLKNLYSNKKGNLWLYLTINPKKDQSFFDFKPLVEKFVQRKMIIQFFYCYEQRGQTEEELGVGFHCHLLLRRSQTIKPNKFVRNAKNTFKNITNVNNPQIFHFRWCPQEYYLDKVAYISGLKNDEEKDLKCKMDTVWRLLHSLSPYYGEPPS